MTGQPHTEQDGIADGLIEQAKGLIEAAAGQPDPKAKLMYFEAAEAAFKAAELARRRQLDEYRAEVDGQVFMLPREHYRFVAAISDREVAAIRELRAEWRGRS
jgi:regulator of protease activity HflC (stomatin/prohibitin superfamily)